MLNKSEFNFLTFEPLISLNFPEIAGKNEYKNVKIREKKFFLWNLHLVGHSAMEGTHKNIDFDYHKVKTQEEWKTDFVKELIDVKQGDLTVEVINQTEIDEILKLSAQTNGDFLFPVAGFTSNNVLIELFKLACLKSMF